MKIAERLMSWIRPHRANVKALDARIHAAMVAGHHATETVGAIVASSRVEEAEANELAESVRERLAKLETRREQRKQDPRISVVIQTIRIMERPL